MKQSFKITLRDLNTATTLLACVGVFVSGTLTLAHFTDRDLPCGIENGCAVVAADPSSQFFGIPTAAYGLAAYVCLALLGAFALGGARKNANLLIGLLLSGAGALVSIALTLYAVLHIHSTCTWCLLSMGVMATLFGTRLLAWERRTQTDIPSRPGSREFAVFSTGMIAAVLGIYGVGKYLAAPDLTRIVEKRARPLPTSSLAPDDRHFLGGARAPLVIVEFADLACPACREGFPGLAKAARDHADQLRLVFRHLPLVKLKGHEDSEEAAVLAEMCPSTASFFRFVQTAYSGKRALSKQEYLRLFRSVGGHDSPALRTEATQRVKRDEALASRLDLRLTPSYLILAPGVPTHYATSTNLTLVLSGREYWPYTTR